MNSLLHLADLGRALLCAWVLSVPGLSQDDAALERGFDQGAAAYRAGAYATASALWSGLLSSVDAPDARAQLLYDLGNAAYRLERPLEACAWYTGASQYWPREARVRDNLELARRAAGLEPLDPGTLSYALWDALDAFREEEAARLYCLGWLLLGLALAGEALRGGPRWRGAAWAGLALALLCAAPWVRAQLRAEPGALCVVEERGAALRQGPRMELEPTGRVPAAALVHELETWPGWVRVETAAGDSGWVVADSLAAIDPR